MIAVAKRKHVLFAQHKTAEWRPEAPEHRPHSGSVADVAVELTTWMRHALTIWSSLGVAPSGEFHDALDVEGRAIIGPRRARVQPRLAYTLCLAESLGWSGPGRATAARAMSAFEANHGLPYGGYRALLAPDGSSLDDTALTYDLAFVLLALSLLDKDGLATSQIAFLDTRLHDGGGYRETGDRPYQSNANMHLFEAFLAWDLLQPDSHWSKRADALAMLAIERMIDPEGGFIREVFDASWSPANGEEGEIVEPGHQFEWSYLLKTWAGRRNHPEGREAAYRLFQAGQRGVDPLRGVAIDEQNARLTTTRSSARLWPQTERLKAALAFAAADPQPAFLEEVNAALLSLCIYLKPGGSWGDVMDDKGRIAGGPSSGSTMYHLITAVEALVGASRSLPLFDTPLDLS